MDQHRWMYVLVVVILPLYSRIYSAFPHEEFFTQKNVLYVGGSKDAFSDKYHKSPVTTIVSPKASLRRCAFANSFLRNSSSFRLELLRTGLSATDNRPIITCSVFLRSVLAPCT